MKRLACWLAGSLAVSALAAGCSYPAAIAQQNAAPPAASAPPIKPPPVTTQPWQEVSVSVSDIDRSAEFFERIGDYETVAQGWLTDADLESWGLPSTAAAEYRLIAAPGSDHGFVRLIRFDDAGEKRPTRPGARAWDTGCYWSIMVRAKNLEAIYDDAIALGWWTETPIAYVEFGPSKLHIVVFKGPDGLQVQAYERLTTPVPEAFAPFSRISQPFNLMQMTRDREAVRRLLVDVLGFDTFFFGPPYVDEEPTIMPLGIPQNLTTSVPYKAGIFYPVEGEFGRMEAIEIEGLEGEDYASRCNAPNLGILRVSYPIDDLQTIVGRLEEADWPIQSGPYNRTSNSGNATTRAITIRLPDGGLMEFFESS